jgi:hypothetical protein
MLMYGVKNGGGTRGFYIRALFVALAGIALLVSWKGLPALAGHAAKPSSVLTGKGTEDALIRKKIDSVGALLHTGDVVFRSGRDATSHMLSQLNPSDKSWSHCGIVIIEHGYPFVYHSIGGEDNPDQKLKRDSARLWFSSKTNSGLGVARYPLSEKGLRRLTETVRRLYSEGRMFDMEFNLKSDDRLYCSEFVYKAFIQATEDSSYLQTISVNGFRYVSIDRIFMNPHARLICRMRYK